LGYAVRLLDGKCARALHDASMAALGKDGLNPIVRILTTDLII
jgi:hypothetical protein